MSGMMEKVKVDGIRMIGDPKDGIKHQPNRKQGVVQKSLEDLT